MRFPDRNPESRGANWKGQVMNWPKVSPPSNCVVVPLVALALLALAACGGGATTPSPAPSTAWTPGASPVPALSIPPQEATTAGFWHTTDGWVFKPTVDIEVTALGFYDDGKNGLVRSHQTAIFDTSDRKATVSATIQPQSPLDGAFRWESVGPVVLRAGHEYVMAWDTPPPFDREVKNPENATIAPELSYLEYRELEGRWGYPNGTRPNTFLSGNFKFRPVSASSPTP